MCHFYKFFLLFSLFIFSCNTLSALEETDRKEIQEIIKGYANSWSQREGKGVADNFTEDADFVNIFGMHFSGKTEIEDRHIKVLQTFLKGSTFEILSTQLREVQPGLVIALIRWRIVGYRSPHSDMNKPGETQEGIFSQVFIHSDKKWKITASQSTLVLNQEKT